MFPDQALFESIAKFLDHWTLEEYRGTYKLSHFDGAYFDYDRGVIGYYPYRSSHRMKSKRAVCEDKWEFLWKAYCLALAWGVIRPGSFKPSDPPSP